MGSQWTKQEMRTLHRITDWEDRQASIQDIYDICNDITKESSPGEVYKAIQEIRELVLEFCDYDEREDDDELFTIKQEEPCNFCGTPDREFPNKTCARTSICTNEEE